MTNTKFALFPFQYKGVQFVSKVAETSRFLPQIAMMGEDFIKMNQEAIATLLPNLETATKKELREAIEAINDGGTEMFLEWVEA